jgi:hypothetical protein
MSQGVGTYIRGLKEEAENKIPVHMRKLTEKVLQVLAAECGKVRLGNRLLFDFSTERDGKPLFLFSMYRFVHLVFSIQLSGVLSGWISRLMPLSLTYGSTL